ncbi:phosphopantetheine-binding protein [Gammaproteobacteria bacterium 45_16_T64]|nr:phosphopantetheine-binding protein [Gammaproteobacteria bacterium 45_16_T64]
MNKPDLINAIHSILENKLCIPQISAFSPNARLNQDLYLDSVLILQLIIQLETDLGFNVPDNALTKDDFTTVASLVDFLLNIDSTVEVSPIPEEFEDIKVHCFVSCLCEIIKADDRVDHRPFYFGVWDADVVLDGNGCISYHSEDINHDFFRHWYEKLYNVSVTPWYDKTISKQANSKRLVSLLANKPDTRQIMVMLDMYRLPERENKFNQNPFPHYVMLEQTSNPETWLMFDPDFRWEGHQEKSQVLQAIASPAVDGGYYFDSQDIRPTSILSVRDYFLACFNKNNPMTDVVANIVSAYENRHRANQNTSMLGQALAQLPVLAIRKYAYEHGLAYFWRALDLEDSEFEAWCDVIEELVENYKLIQYRGLKISNSETTNEQKNLAFDEISTLLAQQNEREFRIKARLWQVFQLWQSQHFPDTPLENHRTLEMNE